MTGLITQITNATWLEGDAGLQAILLRLPKK
jgi:hypothetical protein